MEPDRPRILLDTNVWLDLYIPNRQNAAVSKELVVLGEQKAYLMYPVRIICDVFFQICLEAKQWVRQSRPLTQDYANAIRDHAWDCVEHMRSIATAIGADDSDVWHACKLRALHEDLEDNFVLAAASRAKVDYLVSSDVRLLRSASVAAHTPKDMLRIMSTWT